MTKHLYLTILACLLLGACGSAKKGNLSHTSKKKTHLKLAKGSNSASKIIAHAQSFRGTRYRYGGMTKKGMDCSGLVFTAFQKENIVLPRTSGNMARHGYRIKSHQIQKGDLLFFKTNKTRAIVNHVGLVTAVNSSRILFIHATASKGVITSNLNERYWKQAFAEARRVL